MNAQTTRRNAYSPGEPLVTQEARSREQTGPGGMNTEPSASWDTRSMTQLELSDFRFDGEHPWRDEELMRELYVERRLSHAQIADLFGSSRSVVSKWSRRHGFETHLGQSKEALGVLRDPDTLRELYIEDRKTSEEIADSIGCGPMTVRNWLGKHDIPIRTPRDYLEDEPYKDEATLRYLYHDRELSLRKVAKRLGTSGTAVGYWMDKHDISYRSKSEAMSFSHVPFATGSGGYEILGSNDSRVRHHRLIAIAKGHDPHEIFSGDVEVHHGAGEERSTTPWDNRPDNLAVLTPKEHKEAHKQIRADRTRGGMLDGDRWREQGRTASGGGQP